MKIVIILVLIFALITFLLLTKPSKEDKKNFTPLVEDEPTPIVKDEPSEQYRIEDPVPTILPVDKGGEMPIKPLPVDCQFAQFRPYPERFSYFDCCGNLEEGDGFQPWEKRSPVAIDANKPFEGMDLIGEESQMNC